MRILEKTLKREMTEKVPLWLMRQAGRYLPEYRETRKQAGSFLDLCYNPELASEVTLQPIKRFNFDAAILFSDILVIPDALGVNVQFKEGVGPILEQLSHLSIKGLAERLDVLETNKETISSKLNPVFGTIKKTRSNLDEDKSLIGFCGAPWTVALYMLDEKPSKSSENTRKLAYESPVLFDRLMDILVESSADYLNQQIKAGVNVVQVFDSWAGQVPDILFERAVRKPLLKICEKVKEENPETPIILFPRGISSEKLEKLVKESDGLFEGLGLDYTVDINWAVKSLQPHICIQGNLDPVVMLSTPEMIKKEVLKILDVTTKNPGYIFNFGHGILPTVPVEHVNILVETVKGYK